jgi:hypothetical protein
MNREEYLKLLKDWTDPNPPPVIKEHGKFLIVRDDLLGAGTKARSLDFFVKNFRGTELVFGSCPATGYAQISLPFVANRYGKKVHLFMAKRDPSKYTEYQKRGMQEGAIYHWVDNGMLPVTQKRAKDYAAEDPENRALFPLGLEHPTVTASIIKVALSLNIPEPEEFWTVGSSGTLNRALQIAWPNAKAHVVQVGHSMSSHEIGRACHWKSSLKFDKPAKVLPPFPSAPTYDAKAWEFMLLHARPGALFWNVGA